MSSFYVTSRSRTNKAEFPSNQVNAFKIPLPHPFQHPSSGWKVGLKSISLPDFKEKIYDMVKKRNTSSVWLGNQTVPSEGGGTEDRLRTGSVASLVNNLKDLDSVLDAVHLMNAVIAFMNREQNNEAVQEGNFFTYNGKHTCIVGSKRKDKRNFWWTSCTFVTVVCPESPVWTFIKAWSQDGIIFTKSWVEFVSISTE